MDFSKIFRRKRILRFFVFSKKIASKKIKKKAILLTVHQVIIFKKNQVFYMIWAFPSIVYKRTHQWVIPLWMIYFCFKILLWTPKEVTKMTLKNDNSNLPYLLPSWQNILFIYLYFFRFSFVFRRKKASDFSFFEKTELSRNFHALVLLCSKCWNIKVFCSV